ncbi:MAG: IS5 family transposase [Candidatus Peregrinibacteria bacterium]|nr:IS5 family transposase [Candidatus Peregrinibacteria bacterium]
MTKKTLYRIRNWKAYNASLVARGSITVWISEDAKKGWLHRGSRYQGRPFVFSDAAIMTALTIRCVYRLPLRQTEGFLLSIFDLLGLTLPIPDYSTLSLRAKNLRVDLHCRTGTPLHLILDSTGLKVRGDGEWKRKWYGMNGHRKWRKLHLGINPQTHEIEAVELTSSCVHDATPVPRLLKQVQPPILSMTADGSFDRINVYYALWKQHIPPVIPPRKGAKIRRWRKDPKDGRWKKHVHCMDSRDAAVRTIRKIGKRRWKRESHYHQRSLVETAMFRQKRILGGEIRSRRIQNQRTEAAIRCRVLNIMTQLGMPESIKVS